MLLLATALASSTLIALVLLRENKSERPAGESAEKRGPFRGNVLPRAIRDARAPVPLGRCRGGELDTRELRGRPYVVTFLFTDCRDVCPSIGQEIGQALKKLGSQSEQIAVAAVSVDPRSDTPEKVRAWLDRMRCRRMFTIWLARKRGGSGSGRATSPARNRRAPARACTAPASGSSIAAGAGARSSRPACPVAHDLRVLLREPPA